MKVNSLIGDRAFYKKALSFAIPVMIQNGITNLVNLLDNVMVGSLGTESMSGVSIVNQFVFIFNLLIFGAVSAGGIFSAQYHGLKDDVGVRNTFRFKFLINLVFSVIAVILFLGLDEWLVSTFLHAGEGSGELDPALTLSEGVDYLRVFVVGLIPYAITQVYASTLRETEETKLPMYAAVIALLGNFFLNILFIFVFKQGVRGAALATVISRFAELFFILFATHRKSHVYTFIVGAYRSFKIPTSLVRGILVRGFPLIINELLWSLSITLRNQAYSMRGLDAVAAINISSVIINLINVTYMAFGSSASIIVGEKLGAGKISEAKDTARKLLALSMAVALSAGLLMAIVAPIFPKIYDTTDTVRSLSAYMTWVTAVTIPFFAFSYCAYYIIRSGGRVILTFILDSGVMWTAVMPLTLILAHFTGVSIFWLYLIGQMAEIVKLVPGIMMLKSGSWALSIVSKNARE